MNIPSYSLYSWCPGLFFAMLVTACAVPAPHEIPVSKISAAEWQTIANRRILFGHQSVGNNLLDGVRQLAEEAQINVPITEERTVNGPGITHFRVGRNEDPGSKISDFAAVLREAVGGRQPDIAMMKLCYIDINRDTDAKALASQYVETLESLRRQFPQTRLVAVTVPLTTVQTGPKAWVKRLLGKAPAGYLENVRREEFNRILRQQVDKDLLFDLAEAESRDATTTFQGQRVKGLRASFTDDGGHLNPQGQRVVASAWIHLLAELAGKQKP